MHFKDAFRAQYYLSSLEREIACANANIALLPFLPRERESFLCDFGSAVAEELDQILLPVVAHEIHIAKQAGILKGNTPSARYLNFFIQEGTYTAHARSITEKYPFLFEMIDGVIKASFLNLLLCLKRFNLDYNEIREHFNLPASYSIQKIKILSSSDRHRDQQALLIELSNKSTLIYKPVDLRPDGLFAQFIHAMDFSEPFNLWSRKQLAKEGYGWLDYVPVQECQSLDDVKAYYKRMGVLLAVCDALTLMVIAKISWLMLLFLYFWTGKLCFKITPCRFPKEKALYRLI